MSKNHSKKRVILCRGIGENDDNHNDYVETFQSAGYDCQNLPTLRFEFLSLDKLNNCLQSPDLYGGLIVTSRRSIDAIVLALRGEDLPEQWKNHPIYCVGRSTMFRVQSILKLTNCLCADGENAKDLANRIIETASRDDKNLLYPCSAIARDTIERALVDNRVNVEKIVVYDTLPVETLENDLKLAIGKSTRILVFFSPSTVEFVRRAANQDIWERIKAVAIGPASAEALAKFGFTVEAVSAKPEPQSLLRAVQLARL